MRSFCPDFPGFEPESYFGGEIIIIVVGKRSEFKYRFGRGASERKFGTIRDMEESIGTCCNSYYVSRIQFSRERKWFSLVIFEFDGSWIAWNRGGNLPFIGIIRKIFRRVLRYEVRRRIRSDERRKTLFLVCSPYIGFVSSGFLIVEHGCDIELCVIFIVTVFRRGTECLSVSVELVALGIGGLKIHVSSRQEIIGYMTGYPIRSGERVHIGSTFVVGNIVGIWFWKNFLHLIIISETQVERIDGCYTSGIANNLHMPRVGCIRDDRDSRKDGDGNEELYEGKGSEFFTCIHIICTHRGKIL
ncbi:MAG: hypothetical protein ACD_78C00173G0001 [uncultured bacterium (gcode 4)]|uniref:Uncharacterized protein n=1 Tax=uncultured bacterium (gcode 4) TaxID=1234023 RepID=K1XYJ0_9BACT|nr:MAG: hypothetical protein ACD_78C00173G0001 [uncultured bacterium (gcode 4)]